ncbi:MAG TPA: M20/M25/M40 family metallo-hydrolase, partial [Longimicrobiales bacterium]
MKTLAALFLLACASALSAQNTTYDSAYFAWERGQYITALDGMLRVLRSSSGDAHHDRIALLTGELYHTSELAADGRNVRWSPDGSHGLYETGIGANRRTRVIAQRGNAASSTTITEFAGYNAVFASDGKRIVAFQPVETPEIASARSQLGSLSGAAAAQQRQRIAQMEGRAAKVVVVSVADPAIVNEVATPAITKLAVAATSNQILILGSGEADTVPQLYAAGGGAFTTDNFRKSDVVALGERVVVTVPQRGFGVVQANGHIALVEGSAPAFNADGSQAVYIARDGSDYVLRLLDLGQNGAAKTLKKSALPLAGPAISPDGKRVVYQMMPREDWELFVIDADGQNDRRLTREIQHDQLPRFVDNNTVLAVMGEPRHRRSYLYDINTSERTRLFHNNTVRTVAPEYQWSVSPNGKAVLIQSDRDGNTISTERGIYLVDLSRRVTRPELIGRLTQMRATEVALRAHAQRVFAPLRTRVAAAVADISTDRIYSYARDLFGFESKFITQPGNQLAIQYLEKTLRSFGYEPELQWFEPRPGVRTANVIATLKGTTNPGLLYVISSHFDSVERGPGADDNSSGTTALLEAARVLAKRPQAGTIKFAFFTGEEAGLLGSREFVRRAVAARDKLVGALNNDMVGWKNDQRLDNTIRYSNDGIRDLQHAAAMLFTKLI